MDYIGFKIKTVYLSVVPGVIEEASGIDQTDEKVPVNLFIWPAGGAVATEIVATQRPVQSETELSVFQVKLSFAAP